MGLIKYELTADQLLVLLSAAAFDGVCKGLETMVEAYELPVTADQLEEFTDDDVKIAIRDYMEKMIEPAVEQVMSWQSGREQAIENLFNETNNKERR